MTLTSHGQDVCKPSVATTFPESSKYTTPVAIGGLKIYKRVLEDFCLCLTSPAHVLYVGDFLNNQEYNMVPGSELALSLVFS